MAKEVRRNGFKTVGLLCADGNYHGMIDGIQKALDGVAFTLLIENNGPGGFYTELCRVITLGPAPQELKDALALCLEAHDHTLNQLKPGASCPEIFASHNAFMREHGLVEEKRIHCHSQGYELVERPLIRQDETMTLKEHMHLAVHPVILNERVFMTNTDNYLIGPDGPLPCLHKTPKTIIEVL